VAVLAAILALSVPTTLGQVAVIAMGAAIGGLVLAGRRGDFAHIPTSIPPRVAIGALALFFLLLAGLPLAAGFSDNRMLAVIDGFYRSGALVFGGGHVVLPLLQATVVPAGWVSNDDFLAGYGAAQAVPGPLFTFASFLGTVMTAPPNGWLGGLICLFAIFAPSFLLVIGVLPAWGRLRSSARAQSMLAGVNAAVVGLLAAAFYNPVWTAAIFTPADALLAALAFGLLALRMPQWMVVILGALAAAILFRSAGG
jgi:chromate transporter